MRLHIKNKPVVDNDQNRNGAGDMVDAIKKTFGTVGAICAIIAFLATPIIAMTRASTISQDAKDTANKALELAESNSRDFQFFKGEVNAKLDHITKSQDRIIQFISNIERVPDHG